MACAKLGGDCLRRSLRCRVFQVCNAVVCPFATTNFSTGGIPSTVCSTGVLPLRCCRCCLWLPSMASLSHVVDACLQMVRLHAHCRLVHCDCACWISLLTLKSLQLLLPVIAGSVSVVVVLAIGDSDCASLLHCNFALSLQVDTNKNSSTRAWHVIVLACGPSLAVELSSLLLFFFQKPFLWAVFFHGFIVVFVVVVVVVVVAFVAVVVVVGVFVVVVVVVLVVVVFVVVVVVVVVFAPPPNYRPFGGA